MHTHMRTRGHTWNSSVCDSILCVVFQDRRTALMLAASSGTLELTTILVEAGADVNFKDKVRD